MDKKHFWQGNRNIESMKKQKFKKAYLQRLGGEFINDASFYYNNGLKSLGIPVEYFDEDKPYDLDLNRETLVVAGVPTTIKVFESLGIVPPTPLDIPDELNQPFAFLGREIAKTTIREAIEDRVQTEFGLLINKESGRLNYPIFVKPSEQGKLFNGQIVSSKEELEMFKYCDENLGLNIPIMLSNPLPFVSEYRCFIINGKILDIRKYRGTHEVLPNIHQIKQMVSHYKSAPIAYALDIGMIENGDAFLVECNDAFSLGPYGFDSVDLTRMFIMRWEEILGNN
jgi:hypothetical protein